MGFGDERVITTDSWALGPRLFGGVNRRLAPLVGVDGFEVLPVNEAASRVGSGCDKLTEAHCGLTGYQKDVEKDSAKVGSGGGGDHREEPNAH